MEKRGRQGGGFSSAHRFRGDLDGEKNTRSSKADSLRYDAEARASSDSKTEGVRGLKPEPRAEVAREFSGTTSSSTFEFRSAEWETLSFQFSFRLSSVNA